MIIELLKHDYDTLWLKLFIVFGAWACILVAMFIDLYFGIKKSKEIGEHTTSEGLRRSVHKVVYYYSMMTFALLFDALNPLTFYLPFPLSIVPVITVIFAMALIYTEAKSVREKAEHKLRRRTDASVKELIELFRSREDLFSKALDYLQNEKNKQDEKNN
ncbi:MAG: phage holin family protein [Bergeyella sp.]